MRGSASVVAWQGFAFAEILVTTRLGKLLNNFIVRYKLGTLSNTVTQSNQLGVFGM
jgi:hypothetical protein